MRSLALPLLLLAACPRGAAADGREAGGAASPSTPSGRAPFRVEEMGRFDSPWALAFLPGEMAALVTEKGGRLQLWRRGAANMPVAGVPAVAAGGQGGLLDVVLSPRFAADNLVSLPYSEPSPRGGSGLALARGRLMRDGASARLDGV